MDSIISLASRSFTNFIIAQARFDQAKEDLNESMGSKIIDAAIEYDLAEIEYVQAKKSHDTIHKAWRKSLAVR
jgi:hypothetical protein